MHKRIRAIETTKVQHQATFAATKSTGIRALAVFVIALMCAGVTQAGDVEEAYVALNKKDYATALKKYRAAAANNHAFAQLQIGNIYNEGLGVKQDYAEAINWYKLSAEQGNVDARNNLATMYTNGKGVVQDFAEAARWYKLAAEQGSALAQYNLAVRYYIGQGVRQDHQEAVRWYKLAAAQGDAAAQNNLGMMYSDGEGVAQKTTQRPCAGTSWLRQWEALRLKTILP